MATFISALVDLCKRDSLPRRSMANYLKSCYDLIRQEVPMILYLEPELIEPVKKLREGVSALTQYRPLILEDWEYFRFRDQIIANLATNPISNRKVDKITPNYYLTTWLKFWCLHRVAKENPYGSSQLVWYDFGMGRETPFPGLEFFSTFPKTTFHYGCIQEVVPAMVGHSYYTTIGTYCVGRCFTGSPDIVLRVSELFLEKVSTILNLGYVLLEEQILPLIRLDHPDLFSSHYCFYYSIFKNYPRMRTDLHIFLRLNLPILQKEERWDIIRKQLAELYEDHLTGELEIEARDLLTLLNEYLVLEVQQNGPTELARELGKRIFQYGRKESEFREEVLAHWDQIMVNLSSLPIPEVNRLIISAETITDKLQKMIFTLTEEYQVIVQTPQIPDKIYTLPTANPFFFTAI